MARRVDNLLPTINPTLYKTYKLLATAKIKNNSNKEN